MRYNFEEEITDFIKIICEEQNIELEFYQNERINEIRIAQLNTNFRLHKLQESSRKPDSSYQSISTHPDASIKNIHIWEDQWKFEKDKIKSKLKSIIGITDRIHGRSTSIAKIDNNQLIVFLSKNHLNTPIKAKYKYGLLFREELVAVMSFSNGRDINREGVKFKSFELLRFCNKMNFTVVGGFSKLLNYFILQQKPDDIMTYVDADWSTGKYLKPMGFECIDFKQSIEFWLNVKTGEREYPKMVLKKHKLVLGRNHEDESENQLLKELGYVKIYNSGSYKYILKLKLVK